MAHTTTPPSPRDGQRLTIADVPHMRERYATSNPLPPEEVAAGSNKKFTWKCPAGYDHTWEAQANSIRASKRGGCPFCAGKRPSVTNRLDVLFPDLAAEWDQELNEGPPTVVAGSEKKVWWRCRAADHSWQANIRNRTVLQAGCPRCAAEKSSKTRSVPLPGRELTAVAPDVAASWHPTRNGTLQPDEVAAFSNVPRWWQCPAGHEWEISPAGRLSKGGAGCPYCSGRLATAETSLEVQRPDLASEWHPTKNAPRTPRDVKPGTSATVWWICSAGHEYESRIANRAYLGRGCPYCSGQKIGYGNDLATKAPLVAAEWDHERNGSLTPADVTTGVQRRFWWSCTQGHSWRTTVASRVALGTGCPECGAGWRRSRPEIALQFELAHLLPAAVVGDRHVQTADKDFRVDVLCPELKVAVEYDGNHWHMDTFERDLAKTQALVEAGWVTVRVRQNPLPLTGPHDVPCENGDPAVYPMTVRVMTSLLEEAAAVPTDHPIHAHLDDLRMRLETYVDGGTARAVEEAERETRAHHVDRPKRDPFAPPPRPKPGRSLAELSLAIAAEWHPSKNGGLTPADVANARNASAWWLCSLCGAEWEAVVGQRTRRQTLGCPDCGKARAGAARSRPQPGLSLADVHPDLAAQWHPTRNAPLTPHDVRPGSHKRVWWRSPGGQEWESSVYNRTSKRPSSEAHGDAGPDSPDSA
ncbi:zinc-ribbon domain-containing protein [Micrococcus luteus]